MGEKAKGRGNENEKGREKVCDRDVQSDVADLYVLVKLYRGFGLNPEVDVVGTVSPIVPESGSG